jgi:CheY-like chemotaxis protein
MRVFVGDEVEGVATAKRTVLVVDRYATGRQALCECIAELGHTAIEAECEGDARELVMSSRIDLIIAHCETERDRSLLVELHGVAPAVRTVVVSHVPWDSLPANALLTESFGFDALERLMCDPTDG